ncbi:MAG: HD domain-containing phosphohydrolase [Actinomycetota bacterium]
MRALAGSRHDSLTDALTGLQNRRSLTEDLEDALTGATDERPTVLVLLDLDGFKQYNDTFGHPAGDALLARLAASLNRAVAPHGKAYRLGGDEFCALFTAPSKDANHLAAEAAAAMCQSGHGFSITASHGMAVLPSEAHTSNHALHLADQRLYETKSGRRRSGTAELIRDALVQALEEHQPELRGRLDGVAALTRAVARAPELSSDDIDVLVRAAELHDIGKVAVPDEILDKDGPLDDSEWDFVRQHTVVGDRILSAAPDLSTVAELVRASHEHFDGSGYPDGLAGDEIPLGARVVTICDAYHAMTSSRPYRHRLSRADALDELRRCAGAQFDPEIVESFRALLAPAKRAHARFSPAGQRAH